MKKLFISFCIAVIATSSAMAEEISPSKMPTKAVPQNNKYGIYCPAPYKLMKPCVNCKTELKYTPNGQPYIVKTCLKWKLMCSNEEIKMECEEDCGLSELLKKLSPEVRRRLNI